MGCSYTSKKWQVSKNHKVFSEHFLLDDILTTSFDSHDKRCCDRDNQTLNRLQLKLNAIPSIFPGLPKYLSTTNAKPRSGASTSTARQVQQELALDELNEQLLFKDNILNFSDLINKLGKIYLPDGYIYEIKSSCLIFHLLLHNDNICVAPKLLASVVVHDKLKISAFASQAALPVHIYSHLLTNGSVASLSGLSNILALCKSIAENTLTSTQKSCLIDVALSGLRPYLSLLEAADEDSACYISLLHFICEQLQLLQVSKHGR